ncbi:hypothetical protein Nepgr_005634 [Nepenthes gracilis]|uniref:Pentatricopeptide repeat-containing protein n=1 Tax=Nepenthes gracilis TaxID=150966 RepID=A0AAD3XGM2_NEPGR|nr:hypothetical protein Nepgr_005634 [Nepenthes gracilis]
MFAGQVLSFLFHLAARDHAGLSGRTSVISLFSIQQYQSRTIDIDFKFMRTKSLLLTSNRHCSVGFITFSICTAKSIKQLKQAHAHLLKIQTHYIRDRLLTHLLAKLLQFQSNNLKYACRLFDEIPHSNDQFIWTSLVHSHVLHGQLIKSIHLYAEMHRAGVPPSGFTLSSVLTACARMPRIVEGKQVHGGAIRSGLYVNNVVRTVLLDTYGKCGLVIDARSVFDEMYDGDRDVVAWTAMISGYAKLGMMDDAHQLFNRMGEPRNVVTWTNMVAGYASLGSMELAKKVFDEMPERNSITWLAMISGYGKCGAVTEAKKVFDAIRVPDAACFAAMVACYAQNGYSREAIKLFQKMKEENVKITEVAMVAVISACTQIGDFDMVNELIKDMEKGYCDQTHYVSNALIHMHSKCGNIDQAWKEFNRMNRRDAVTYSTLISAMADHGKAREALDVFSMMQTEGIEPTHVTFVSVLNACSRAGLMQEGLKNFDLMTRIYGIKPLPEHYACLVELLGRNGELLKACDLIVNSRTATDAVAWDTLFSACCVHGNVELGEIVASRLLEMEPWNTGNCVILANLYASVGRWDDAERLRKMMREYEMKKSPGCSWVSYIKLNKTP